jgi:phosphoribosylamine--glycine ligase
LTPVYSSLPFSAADFNVKSPLTVLVLGIGAFAQSTLRILRENGARVVGYLTRDYGHPPAEMEAKCYSFRDYPDPLPLLAKHKIGLVIPMSIDWAAKPWAQGLIDSGVPIFCPTGEALEIERERDLARRLCAQFGIPFPKAFWAKDRKEAEAILARERRPFVIKNPLCGPFSPIHTIVCETVDDTRAWLPRLDYRDGVFLQEYLGRAEAGHIAFISAGEIHSVVTNQEYKRAFNGNQGVVAGAPLGGLVEQDPEDKYGLARTMLRPLLPWFRETNFHGPIQVTAMRNGGRWLVVEYNVRIGVTSGAMILRMLRNPVETLASVARNEPLDVIKFHAAKRFGCSITLAGYGYPYTQVNGPELPIQAAEIKNCDVWWNEVRRDQKQLLATGHRIADVVALSSNLTTAIDRAYVGIGKIRCLASYYRTDVGASLWPPGHD